MARVLTDSMIGHIHENQPVGLYRSYMQTMQIVVDRNT